MIWYINSFFFILFFGLGFVSQQRAQEIPRLCGSYESACKTVYDALTDPLDEAILVSVLVTLALGPQLLTYLLSGLSGSASAPKLVRQIREVSVWSIIKFLAGLGGILCALSLSGLAAGKPAQVGQFILGYSMITTAFAFAALHLETAIVLGFPVLARPKFLAKIHKFFTRHADPKEQDVQ